MEIMEVKNLLITGGLGNLGSWLTSYFVNSGYKVTVLAKNRRPILSDLNFEFIACDIADEASCKEVLNGKHFDVVIHTASVNDGFVPNYPKLAVEVNALGTRNILEGLKNKMPGHFIYFSTFQVYGKYTGHISEETPLETRNDYGNTHLFAEHYVTQFAYTHNLPYSIVRLTNSYGAPKDPDSSKWYLILNDLSKMAFEKKEIKLSSNGQAPRDFIWMGDVCKVVEGLAKHGPTQDVFNISGQLTYRMIDIAGFVRDAYKEMFGEELQIEVNHDDKSSFPDGFSVSSEKLRRIVPFTCENHFVSEAKNIFNLLKDQQ